MPDFLLEIGCEEIPARMLYQATQDLQSRVASVLDNNGLRYTEIGHAETPRRLSIIARGIPASQADTQEQLTGPAIKVAYKDGEPTTAAHAFAKKVGVDISKLQRITTAKGEYLSAKVTNKGKAAQDVLSELLPKEIAAIYWPKNMYWRRGKPERFVRPVRWIVALLDDEVIPVEFAGIRAGNQSRGHRILGPKSVTISAPTKYIETLRGAHIAASAAEREQLIRKALDAVTRAVPGARWREDAELLKTVVNLTEWPSAILGNFDPQFLSLPEEVLVTVMRDHQKYFAVEDANGKLAPHFLAVLNTDGDPDGLIRHGNERVLRARFSDAQFFWNTDQKIPLVDRVEMLKAVTFQKDLGSYDEKAQRVGRLAAKVADATEEVNLSALLQAVRLAKTDLTTELVREFTELQGIVGGLYAQAQGLPQAVADAVYDHYKPESMEDSVPRTLEGAVLSVADKADSIAGMFGLGLAPSGSKDPFALRRQANGIIKILAEHRIRLSLADLVLDSFECYKNTDAEARFKFPTTGLFKIRVEIQGTRSTQEKLVHIPELLAQNELIRQTWDFLGERVAFFLKDIQKYPAKVVKSVVTVSFDDVFDSLKRASAAKTISESREFEPVFSAFKRMKNIVRQAKERGEFLSDQTEFDPNMFQEDAETHLWETVQEIGNRFGDYRKGGQYVGAFRLLGELRKPIDEFFENVRVMTDDPEMRKNRLCLLENLVDNFNTIVDLSELAPEFAT